MKQVILRAAFFPSLAAISDNGRFQPIVKNIERKKTRQRMSNGARYGDWIAIQLCEMKSIMTGRIVGSTGPLFNVACCLLATSRAALFVAALRSHCAASDAG